MKLDRRNFIKGMGGILSLPLLESLGTAQSGASPTRFLVVGNPLGMHPENFSPIHLGKIIRCQPPCGL